MCLSRSLQGPPRVGISAAGAGVAAGPRQGYAGSDIADAEQVVTEADAIPISGQVFACVWDALEDSPAEAANMRLRSELMIAVKQAEAGWGLTQAEAARRLEVTQPRLNDLLRGCIGSFSLDALILLATRAGLRVRVQIEQAAA